MSEESFKRTDYQNAADFIRRRAGSIPPIAIILGSGLNPLAEEAEAEVALPYSQIPGFPVTTVKGHVGRFIVGRLYDVPVIILQGRPHYYEGFSVYKVVFPVRTLQFLEVKVLIVTNAAGGLNPAFNAGDLMLIADHINLMGMGGVNPLRGPSDETMGPRFLDMTNAYDLELRRLAHKAAKEAGLELHEGVYVMLPGPNYETPAEVRFLRLIGGDAVGMSTVPEVLVARHGGIRVLGISGISNAIPLLPPEKPEPLTHEEVLEIGNTITRRLSELFRRLLPIIHSTVEVID